MRNLFDVRGGRVKQRIARCGRIAAAVGYMNASQMWSTARGVGVALGDRLPPQIDARAHYWRM